MTAQRIPAQCPHGFDCRALAIRALAFRTPRSLTRLTALLVAITFAVAAPVQAQFHEPFDSPTPSWQRTRADCVVPTVSWKQTRANEIELRNRYEKIAFTCGPGTHVLIAHDVPPALVISDLNPSVRIKASRAGVQMRVRIVLPHVPAADGNGPLTTTLLGPTYDSAQRWQTLQFANHKTSITESLKEKLWLLRRQYGPHVTAKDAYLDQVILNLHCGAGESICQIDDLKVDGTIDASAIANQTDGKNPILANTTPGAAGSARTERVARAFSQTGDDQSTVQPASLSLAASRSAQVSGKQPSLVQRDGTVLLVKKKPFFPRIIEHNGEAFDLLVGMGFNTIELKNTATEAQLNEAQRLGVWIVCPPPTSIGLTSISFRYDRVLAWSVGRNATGRKLDIVNQRIREIRQSDNRDGRPIVVNAQSHHRQLCQNADVLSVGVEPLGTSFIASRYSDWVAERRRAIANGKPMWVDVQTQLTRSQLDQISAVASQVPPTPIEPQQIRFLAWEALAGGARGLRFRSRSRLDAPDPSSQLRATTLEWVNGHLDVIEPWAVGGAVMGELPQKNDRLEVTALQTSRSRLLLIQRPTHHEQYWAGDVPPATLAIQDSATTFTDRAYLITETGLQPLSNARNHQSNQIRIEDCPYASAVILTQDPLVVNQVSQAFQRTGQRSLFELHSEISRQWMAITQLVEKQMTLMGRSSPAASGSLNEAINAFRTVDSMIAKNSLATALKFLDRADERMAFVRREIMAPPLGSFQSKTSSPFVSHFSLIPLHWELAMRLDEQTWRPNGLAGGDFENLQHMLAAGWENHRLDDGRFQTKVELAESAMVDGRYGCRLSVEGSRGSAGQSGPIETAPLWIGTPAIAVKAGQLVRIHGWVNVPQTISANQDGLTITDSLAGTDLMERIPMTDGWQEFTLYRTVADDTDLRVTFSLTGLGQALLDEVTVRAIDVPKVERQASRP